MTFAGKIMVFVILVFCVACMFLALTVYTAQNNWPEAYAKLQQDKDNLQKSLTNATAEQTRLQTELKETQSDAQQRETALNAQIDGLKADAANLQKSETEARSQLGSAQQQAKEATDEAVARRNETNALREKFQLAINERDQAINNRVQAEDARNASQQQLDVAQRRNKELVDRVAQLTNLAMQGGLNPDQPVAAAPPVVEGYVRNATPDNQLVEISIGSDDGLQPNHELDVYRVGATPDKARFLGRIRVSEVYPDRAVAKYLRPWRGRIQKGDHVTSKLQ